MPELPRCSDGNDPSLCEITLTWGPSNDSLAGDYVNKLAQLNDPPLDPALDLREFLTWQEMYAFVLDNPRRVLFGVWFNRTTGYWAEFDEGVVAPVFTVRCDVFMGMIGMTVCVVVRKRSFARRRLTGMILTW